MDSKAPLSTDPDSVGLGSTYSHLLAGLVIITIIHFIL